MKISVITMFPELFGSFLKGPIPTRAMDRGAAQIELVDIKEYAGGCYRHIDDSTFGGGAGMILRAKPVLDALSAAMGESLPEGQKAAARSTTAVSAEGKAVTAEQAAGKEEAIPNELLSKGVVSAVGQAADNREIIPEESIMTEGRAGQNLVVTALTPAGALFCQETAARYAQLDHLVLICGHYEGMDERIYSRVQERVSIGDYILSGGETAAMVVMDAVLRLLPGILRAQSTAEESFCGRGYLEYPQYTRPADLDGDKVPEVLLSGNHAEIRRWRLRESLKATLCWRPDLLEKMELTPEEKAMLSDIREEQSR